MTDETNPEEVVTKYKKLLSLARNSLESNQATIAAKDKQINQLITALEEEKSNKLKKPNLQQGKDDENASMPRNLLRRIDIGKTVWVLIEYEGIDDAWKEFPSEQDLDDYIQRIPGVPLTKPVRCLTPQESKQIEDESKKKVDRVVEEFRRYKVRTEIVRKQKDADTKQALSNNSAFPSPASFENQSIDSMNSDDIQRFKTQLQEQENKWRLAFERAVKENEQLRTRANETVIISQLREQYESCLKDKNELQEKLKIYEKVLRESSSASGGKSLEQSYIELRDEYKEYRRRIQALEVQRQLEEELRISSSVNLATSQSENSVHVSVALQSNHNDSSSRRLSSNTSSSVNLASSDRNPDNSSNSSESNIMSSAWSGNAGGMMESKVKYLRQMIFQYLSCRDVEVKLHIEGALMAIFRFNDQERYLIDERKREESQDTLVSITNFLTNFAA